MPFTIIRQDITQLSVDAIVNAANPQLQMGGGVCGAIFHAAGPEQLQRVCNRKAPVPVGEAVLTPAYQLPAKYIIHAVGPIYSQQTPAKSGALLRSAYLSSLELAVQKRCKSIAFPLISSGIYGYPKAAALQVATVAITNFLMAHELKVYLTVFDKEAFQLSQQLLGDVESYIDEHYAGLQETRRRRKLEGIPFPTQSCQDNATEKAPLNAPMCAEPARSAFSTKAILSPKRATLEELVGNLDEPFSTTLFRLIDSKGKSDVEVYKKANLDRKLFSKIRSVKGYTPKKPTILALAIALELSLEETDDLLQRAGYALSHANKFDVIVEYFIVNGRYDIFAINEILFQYDQPLLGA